MIAALKPLYANPMPRLGMRRGNVTFIRKGPKLTMQTDDARGAESVIFDESQRAEDGAVTRWLVSRDGAHAFVEQAKNGLDRRGAVIVETKTGRAMEHLVGLEGSEVAWARRGFFYGYAPPDVPHADRFGQRSIRFHAVGTEQASDPVVVPPSKDKNASSAMNPIGATDDGTRLVVQTSGNWQHSTFGGRS